MGFIAGGKSEPPPPPPPPPPITPEREDPRVEQARVRQRVLQAQRRGRRSLVHAGELEDPAPTRGVELLGR